MSQSNITDPRTAAYNVAHVTAEKLGCLDKINSAQHARMIAAWVHAAYVNEFGEAEDVESYKAFLNTFATGVTKICNASSLRQQFARKEDKAAEITDIADSIMEVS